MSSEAIGIPLKTIEFELEDLASDLELNPKHSWCWDDVECKLNEQYILDARIAMLKMGRQEFCQIALELLECEVSFIGKDQDEGDFLVQNIGRFFKPDIISALVEAHSPKERSDRLSKLIRIKELS